jgi:hypothetical protein
MGTLFITQKGFEIIAEKMITILPAPLGLSEYRCTDGKEFYDKEFAISHQVGIERENFKTNPKIYAGE